MSQLSTPDLLVVAEPGDGGARAVCRLVSAGLGPTGVPSRAPTGSRAGTPVGTALRPVIALISPERLAAARWSQRLGADGSCRTVIVDEGPRGRERADGGTARSVHGQGWRLDSDRLRLVWFRARWWRQRGVAAADADYAEAELTALLVSWLSALGHRTVNRVDGASPVGPSWSPARWLAVAAEAGLPVAGRSAATSARLVDGWRGAPWDARRPWDGSVSRLATQAGTQAVTRVLVVDGVAGGALPTGSPVRPGALRALAELSGCRVLQIGIDRAGAVVDVDPCPPITGTDEVRRVAALVGSALDREQAA